MADNRSWLLPRQHNLLSSHLGKFTEHQAANTLALKFWPKLHRKFFKIWKSQSIELKEWKVLKEMVEGGQTPMPSCLGGDNSPMAKKAGLDITIPEEKGDEGDDSEDLGTGQDGTLSDISSDDDDVRAANEAEAMKIASGGAPDGASNGASAPKKKKKKKKPVVINIPERFKDAKTWKEKRTEQIKRWFYNATAKSRTSVPKVSIDFKNLFTGALGGRSLTEPQMYAKMYYEARVKSEVDQEVEERGLNKGQRIALMTKRLQESYAAETDKVKNEVRAELAKVAREREEAKELLKKMIESGGEKEQTPEEYARIQDSLKPILRCFFDMLGPLAGFSFFVVGGGPKSSNPNGTMGYVSYNRGWGEERDEFTFNRWYDGYQEKVIKPFGKFCHEVFPEELRLQRAIEIVECENMNLEALRKSGRNFGRLQRGGEIPKRADKNSTPSGATQPPAPKVEVKDTMERNKVKPTAERKKGKKVQSSSSSSEDDDESSEDPSDPSEDEGRSRRKGKGKGMEKKKTSKNGGGKNGGGKKRQADPWADSNDSEVDADDEEGHSNTRKSRGKGKKTAKRSKHDHEEEQGLNGVSSEKVKGKGSKDRAKAKTMESDAVQHEKGDREKAAGTPTRTTKTKKGAVGKAVKEDDAGSERADSVVGDPDVDDADADVDGAGGEHKAHKPEPKRRTRRGREVLDTEDRPNLSGEGDGDSAAELSGSKLDEMEQDNGYLSPSGPSTPGVVPESPFRYQLPRSPTPVNTNKRKPDSMAAIGGERSKRLRRQTREPEQWVVETRDFLLECGSGKVWEGLVEAWYNFETHGFEKHLRVTEVTSRPGELKRWLAARKSSMPCAVAPLVEDKQAYRTQWMAWWDDLKGEEAEGSANATKAIRRAGPCGVVTILLGLAFWSEGQARNAEWRRVVGELKGFLQTDE